MENLFRFWGGAGQWGVNRYVGYSSSDCECIGDVKAINCAQLDIIHLMVNDFN